MIITSIYIHAEGQLKWIIFLCIPNNWKTMANCATWIVLWDCFVFLLSFKNNGNRNV